MGSGGYTTDREAKILEISLIQLINNVFDRFNIENTKPIAFSPSLDIRAAIKDEGQMDKPFPEVSRDPLAGRQPDETGNC